MSDEFLRRRLDWQDQVLADHALTLLAFKVAMYLGRHVNRETGDAWPAQGTIAEFLRVTRRGVQGAIEQLVERGHLEVTVCRGRGGANRYRPKLHNANGGSHYDDPKCEPSFAGGANHGSQGVRTAVRTNPLNEPFEENTSPEGAREHMRGRQRQVLDGVVLRTAGTPDPGWWPSQAGWNQALGELGLSPDDLRHETAHFRDRAIANGSTYRDIERGWFAWLRSPQSMFRQRQRDGPRGGQRQSSNGFWNLAKAADDAIRDRNQQHSSAGTGSGEPGVPDVPGPRHQRFGGW